MPRFKNQHKIRHVNLKFLREVIENRTPCGHFLTKEGHKWVAVDNSTFNAWTEEFSSKRQAVRWLNGKAEVTGIVNYLRQWL